MDTYIALIALNKSCDTWERNILRSTLDIYELGETTNPNSTSLREASDASVTLK